MVMGTGTYLTLLTHHVLRKLKIDHLRSQIKTEALEKSSAQVF